ncbi:hypothetical protein OPV22_012321 [Ensete ventricosum]|uniref:SPARK domain-containing protein n=1 Tax=Ensete ventricosum TaxID=4639 RepID=A0AAV8R5U8_ENSVE|nr:hypothetical protein OPV22_012321 [Ensete ventricosum]
MTTAVSDPLRLLFVAFSLLLLLDLALSQNSSSCPLDFSVTRKFVSAAASTSSSDSAHRCTYLLQLLHLTLSQYLRTDSLFHPPVDAAAACWTAFQAAVAPLFSAADPFDVRTGCGFRTEWIAQGCMNITSRRDFEKVVPVASISDMDRNCNQSFQATPACTACTVSLNRVKAAYLPGPDYGNVSDCTSYPAIYAGGAISRLGPSDDANAYCFFLLNSTTSAPSPSGGGSSTWIYGVAAGCFVFLLVAALAAWFWVRRYLNRRRKPTKEVEPSLALESISASTTLVKFRFDEIKQATKNFSRDNIIGRGGYGNSDVYSFGVVLLELLSGKKAFVSMGEGQAFVLSDWAWSLVRRGRTMAVLEEGMEELGPTEVLEKYVLVAVLCTHPQLHARPKMDQIVKILETDLAVPSIPDRPIPIVSNIEDIERSVSSSGSEKA